jgi:phosphate transport system substrate-binding protein
MKKTLIVFSVLVICVFLIGQAKVDTNLPKYKKTSGISGNLSSVGSDTLLNLMTFWSEDFSKIYPSVKTQIEGKGSSTAPPALIEGTAQIGPMSRKMKDTEVDAFVAKFGYKPTTLAIAIDTLAVYVNKDNPVKGLKMEQIDAIFSKNRNCGHREDLKTWGQIGLSGTWSGKPISLYGRNSASGTYGYFKKNAMCAGDYKDTVKEQPGSASVVQGIERDTYGIGYSGIGYKTSGVRAIPLAKKGESEMYDPSVENALAGKYPLARALYLNVNKKPGQPLDPLVREFITFVLSQEGQHIVVKDGYIPLPASSAKKELQKIQ